MLAHQCRNIFSSHLSPTIFLPHHTTHLISRLCSLGAVHMLNMPDVEDYDNPEVTAAGNPQSPWGYAHGPIPNNNPEWRPDGEVTAAVNATRPVEGVWLCRVNGGVCDIAVNGTQMCGQTFSSQPTLRRHIRNAHPGAIENPNRRNLSNAEQIWGENVLKLWVRSGGWRSARYLHEPGCGIGNNLIAHYADELEELAAANPEFAARFGRQFHREATNLTSGSGRKRKCGHTPPPLPDSLTPKPRKKTKSSLAKGTRASRRLTETAEAA